MRWIILLAVCAVGCSGSPTSPTPTAPITPPVVTTPPVVVVPPVTPAANPLLSDPRFDRRFYEQLALGSRDLGGTLAPLRRHLRPPLFYVMTVDNQGNAINARTLDATAAALINTAPIWNGGQGIQGLSYGTAEPAPVGPCAFCSPDPALEHHISVKWDATTNIGLCARSDVGGNTITVFLRTAGCTCSGSGLAVAPVVIKHELGHAMGYWHTDSTSDVMGAGGTLTCDLSPSAREVFHATVAYSQPQGSLTP